jgi:hypothetical protein
LLSVAEDQHLKNREVKPLEEDQLGAFVDGLLNYLSDPLRVCFKESKKLPEKIDNRLIDEHYQLAQDWIEAAKHYSNFCSIFPLWHRGKIDPRIKGNKLEISEWRSVAVEYEVYNRLVRKSGDRSGPPLDPYELAPLIMHHSSATGGEFKVDFNPKLVKRLFEFCEKLTEPIHNLPDDWEFTHFTIGQFRLVFKTIQAMLIGWFVARVIYASNGMKGLGYRSAVWVVSKSELKNRLRSYTGLVENAVNTILRYITFGSEDIREPDIAIQPLIDLYNGTYALSPFVWQFTDVERNFCVLMNMIDSERRIYSKLVNEKELLLRNEMIDVAKSLGWEHKFGMLKDSTDIDLAFISGDERVCLSIELKWFIEPAEIREAIDRSKELTKGVVQAKRVNRLFKTNDEELVKQILEIDSDYDFQVVVGSKNWIGNFDVQDVEIPIVKTGHLLKKIRESSSLTETVRWLRNRDYLPAKNEDFKIIPVDVSCGEWQADWYGFKIL